MAKLLERIKALKLRKEGCSIRDIAKELKVSRSSVSVWCERVVLSEAQKISLHKKMRESGHVGRMVGVESNRKKRIDLLQKAKEEASLSVGKMTQRDVSMLSLGLYWGEGSKNKERKFVFTNSDVDAVRFTILWLISLGVSRDDIVASIYINQEHEDRLKKVQLFWMKKLEFTKSQFRKTVLVKVAAKKVYENRETYFGVLRLTVKRSTYLKALVMSKLKCVKDQV